MLIYFFGAQLKGSDNIITNLCKIPGVGNIKAFYICNQVGLLPETSWSSLTEKQVSSLSFWLENSFSVSHIIGPEIFRASLSSKKFLSSIKSKRGFRLSRGLPVNGQRSHTNAKTAKRLNKITK